MKNKLAIIIVIGLLLVSLMAYLVISADPDDDYNSCLADSSLNFWDTIYDPDNNGGTCFGDDVDDNADWSQGACEDDWRGVGDWDTTGPTNNYCCGDDPLDCRVLEGGTLCGDYNSVYNYRAANGEKDNIWDVTCSGDNVEYLSDNTDWILCGDNLPDVSGRMCNYETQEYCESEDGCVWQGTDITYDDQWRNYYFIGSNLNEVYVDDVTTLLVATSNPISLGNNWITNIYIPDNTPSNTADNTITLNVQMDYADNMWLFLDEYPREYTAQCGVFGGCRTQVMFGTIGASPVTNTITLEVGKVYTLEVAITSQAGNAKAIVSYNGGKLIDALPSGSIVNPTYIHNIEPCVVNGATLTPAEGGCSLNFDGNDEVTFPGFSGSPGYNGQHTISTWVTVPNRPSVRSWLLFWGPAYQRGAIHWLFKNDGYTQLGVFSGSQGVPSYPLNAWTHFVQTYDGNRLRTYKNGVKTHDLGFSRYYPTLSNHFNIGRYFWGTENFFQGGIDDLRLYNKALTDAEILELYNAAENTEVRQADLLSHYDFNDCSGQTITDKKGSNDGVLGSSSSAGGDDPTFAQGGRPTTSSTTGVGNDWSEVNYLAKVFDMTPPVNTQPTQPTNTCTKGIDYNDVITVQIGDSNIDGWKGCSNGRIIIGGVWEDSGDRYAKSLQCAQTYGLLNLNNIQNIQLASEQIYTCPSGYIWAGRGYFTSTNNDKGFRTIQCVGLLDSNDVSSISTSISIAGCTSNTCSLNVPQGRFVRGYDNNFVPQYNTKGVVVYPTTLTNNGVCSTLPSTPQPTSSYTCSDGSLGTYLGTIPVDPTSTTTAGQTRRNGFRVQPGDYEVIYESGAVKLPIDLFYGLISVHNLDDAQGTVVMQRVGAPGTFSSGSLAEASSTTNSWKLRIVDDVFQSNSDNLWVYLYTGNWQASQMEKYNNEDVMISLYGCSNGAGLITNPPSGISLTPVSTPPTPPTTPTGLSPRGSHLGLSHNQYPGDHAIYPDTKSLNQYCQTLYGGNVISFESYDYCNSGIDGVDCEQGDYPSWEYDYDAPSSTIPLVPGWSVNEWSGSGMSARNVICGGSYVAPGGNFQPGGAVPPGLRDPSDAEVVSNPYNPSSLDYGYLCRRTNNVQTCTTNADCLFGTCNNGECTDESYYSYDLSRCCGIDQCDDVSGGDNRWASDSVYLFDETYFCIDNGEFSKDLDNAPVACANAKDPEGNDLGLVWTGSRCCSEPEDNPDVTQVLGIDENLGSKKCLANELMTSVHFKNNGGIRIMDGFECEDTVSVFNSGETSVILPATISTYDLTCTNGVVTGYRMAEKLVGQFDDIYIDRIYCKQATLGVQEEITITNNDVWKDIPYNYGITGFELESQYITKTITLPNGVTVDVGYNDIIVSKVYIAPIESGTVIASGETYSDLGGVAACMLGDALYNTDGPSSDYPNYMAVNGQLTLCGVDPSPLASLPSDATSANYCELNTDSGYYCDHDNSWKYSSRTNDPLQIITTYGPSDWTLTNNQGCCIIGECWSGNECVVDQSNDPLSLPYYETTTSISDECQTISNTPIYSAIVNPRLGYDNYCGYTTTNLPSGKYIAQITNGAWSWNQFNTNTHSHSVDMSYIDSNGDWSTEWIGDGQSDYVDYNTAKAAGIGEVEEFEVQSSTQDNFKLYIDDGSCNNNKPSSAAEYDGGVHISVYQCTGPSTVTTTSTEGKRCISGMWEDSNLKIGLDGIEGYCPSDEMCLVSVNDNPACVTNGQYVNDYLCTNGEWSSRTKLLAATMVDIIYNGNSIDEHTIYCGPYYDVLNYYDYWSNDGTLVNEMFILGDVNNVCVLDKDGQKILGFSLNDELDNVDIGKFLGNVDNCNFGVGGMTSCDNNKIWYEPNLKLLLYSNLPFSISSNLDYYTLFQGDIQISFDAIWDFIQNDPELLAILDSNFDVTKLKYRWLHHMVLNTRGVAAVSTLDDTNLIGAVQGVDDDKFCALINSYNLLQTTPGSNSQILCKVVSDGTSGDQAAIFVANGEIYSDINPQLIWTDLTGKLR